MSRFSLPTVPARWRVPVAFAAVYLIWGSTYLAIRFAVETLPPLLMAGLRFLIAGTILYVLNRGRGPARPTIRHWRTALIVGGLLLLGGNGGVVWAEQQHVPSGVASLMVATVPLWMALLNWQTGDRVRPTLGVAVGLGLGLAGIFLLLAPTLQGAAGGQAINPAGLLALVAGSLFWSIGSLYSRRAALPDNAFLATGMEMLTGGTLLILAGLLTGEAGRVAWDQISTRSVLAFGYLVLLGSLVGFTAYIWLLRNTTPAKASTYAFVNPIVAVFLGWSLGGEPLTVRTMVAAAVIIAGVALITTYQPRPGPALRPEPILEQHECG